MVRLWPIILALLLSLQCDQPVVPGESSNDELIYFSSFENDADTSGWQGYGYDLRNEAPPGGGNRSLFVSGGCIFPHALFTLKPLEQDSRVVLRCWGKNIGIGGEISLAIGENGSKSVSLSIKCQNWMKYESETLFVPSGSRLTLSAFAGGIVWSAILVDQIELRRKTK